MVGKIKFALLEGSWTKKILDSSSNHFTKRSEGEVPGVGKGIAGVEAATDFQKKSESQDSPGNNYSL
jgi:hypothetical protein